MPKNIFYNHRKVDVRETAINCVKKIYKCATIQSYETENVLRSKMFSENKQIIYLPEIKRSLPLKNDRNDSFLACTPPKQGLS